MTKKYYYLVSGEVFFINPENEAEGMGSSKLNTTITTEEPFVTASNLAKATTGLQMMLHQRAGASHLNIVDVFISNVSPLGQMTEKVFTAGMNVTQPVTAQ